MNLHPFKPGDRVVTNHAGGTRTWQLKDPKRGIVTATVLREATAPFGFCVNIQLTEAPWEKWTDIPIEFIEHLGAVEQLAEPARDWTQTRQGRNPQSRRAGH